MVYGRLLSNIALVTTIVTALVLGGCSDDAGQVAEHIGKARQYVDRDDPRAAILELKSALQLDLENIEGRLMLGRLYLDQGLGAAALKELETARRLRSTDADLAVDIARAKVLDGRFDDALEAIRRDGAETAKWKTVAGLAWLGKQEPALARAEFEKAIALDGSHSEARRGLAQAALAAGDSALAKEQIDKALTGNNQELQTWVLKGELELSLRDLPAAQASFERVLQLAPDAPVGRIGLARALLAQNKADEASTHIRALERLKLNNPMVDYLRALEARQNNDIKTAREALREVLSVAPNHAPSQLLMGQILLLQRELDQARELLTRYVAQVPGNPTGRKLLAAVLIELGDADEAIQTLMPLEQATPDDSQVLSLLGTAYMKIREFDKGQAYMDRASKQAPEASAIRTQLAITHLAKGDNEEAATELQAVIDQDPQFERADFLLVLTQMRAGKLDAALAAAQNLVRKHPDKSQSHNLLGAVHETRKELEAARQAYQRSADMAPESRAGRLNIARMDMLSGNAQAARQGFEAVLDSAPSDTTALMGLAKLASDEGDAAQSLELLERARSENPKAVRPRLVLASYYLRRGEAEKAVLAAEEASEFAPDTPAVQVILGRAQMASGQGDAALTTFSRLAKNFPNEPSSHLNLAMAQQTAGQNRNARRSLHRALSLDPAHHFARAALGQLELRSGKLDVALKIADQLEKDLPDAAAANSLRGDVHIAQRQNVEAAAAYEKAFTAIPSSPLLAKLMLAEQRAGKVASARQRAEQWLKKNPEDGRIRSLLAAASHESGNQDQAISDYERVLEKNPNNVLALNNLAWLYDARGDSRALEHAERAYELLPARPEIADTYGWLLVKSGKVERGLALIEKALQGAGDNGDIRYHHAAALHKAGESSRAQVLLDELLRDSADFSERKAAETLFRSLPKN